MGKIQVTEIFNKKSIQSHVSKIKAMEHFDTPSPYFKKFDS